MAEKKKLKKQATQIPSGGTGIEDVIKGSIMDFSDTLTMDFASFFLGSAQDGSDMKKSKSKAQANKKSLLGQKDSIYTFLQDIKDSLTNKQIKEILPKSLMLVSANSELIKNALYDKDESITQALIRILSSQDENSIKFAEDQFEELKEMFDEKRLDDVMQKVVTAENQAAIALKMAQTYYESFNNTALKNESNIQKIIDSYKEQSDKDKEELQKLITAFTDSNQKLSNINEEIRKDNESKIVEAKLKLIIEGIDTSTIDALIKFSNLNLDKLDQNAKSLIIFFKSLKVLEKIKLEDSLKHLSMLSPIITGLIGHLKMIKQLNKLVNNEDMIAFGDMMDKIRRIFLILNDLSDASGKADSKSILKSFGALGATLGILVSAIPLFAIVNSAFATHSFKGKSGKLINLENTSNIFIDLDLLFGTINEVRTINNGSKLLASLGYLYAFDNILLTMLPIMYAVNAIIKKDSFDEMILNMIKVYGVEGDQKSPGFRRVFEILNSIAPIKHPAKLIKSFLMLPLINDSMIVALKNLDKLDKKVLEDGNNKINKMNQALLTITKTFVLLDSMKVNNKIQKKVDEISKLFGDTNDKNIQTSLITIFRAVKNFRYYKYAQEVLPQINSSILDLKTIIENLNSINALTKDAKNFGKDLDNYLEVLEEAYQKIQEKFDQIIATGDTAEKIKAANKKIADAMESTNETIVKTSANEKDIKKSVIAMEGMTEFMLSAALVMTIGAFIVMLGGGKFIKAALQFGLSLAVFEGLVLMPALIFNSQQGDAFKGIEGFNSFVVTCAITMTIGALVMALGGGKLVKNALKFGVTLGLFEMIVVAPLLAFGELKNNVFESLHEFNSFIVTCTIVMLVGALVVQLAGGKVIKNALKFGIVLMEFEALVVAPFILFGLIKKNVFEGAKEFTSLLIVTTIIFLMGAAVMALSGGKMVKHAMAFTMALMKFEAMIIAPFLLFNLLKKSVFDGIKSFTVAVTICTLSLLIGAAVMKNPRLVQTALKFATTLMIFEAMIIAPFLIFNKIGRHVMGGLKDFSVVVFVATTVLIVGSIFMTMNGGVFPIAAMQFAGLLALFETAITLPMLIFKKISKDALSGAKDFGIFVALSSFALIIGAFFIANYGSKPVAEFGIVLGIFVIAASGAAALMGHFGEHLNKARDFGVFVLLSSAALLLGALFITKYGSGSAIGYAVLLGTFVALMGAVMVGISFGFKAAGGEASVISEMAALGSFLLMATASIALGSWVIDKYGWKSVGYALLLVAFIGLMGAVFVGLTYLGVMMAPGAAVAALMGVALLTLTGSLMLVNLLFELDPGGKNLLGNIGTLASVLTRLLIPFTLLGILSLPIAFGSVVAVAMGVAITILGASLTLINVLMDKFGNDLKDNIETLNEILGFSYLAGTFSLLGLLSVPIALGSAAAVLMGVGITLLGGALALVHTFIDPIKDTIIDDILTMQKVVVVVGILAGELALAIIPMTLGLPGLALMNLFCLGITTSTLMVAKSVKKMNEVGDITKNTIQIAKNIQAFVDIPDKVSFGGLVGILNKIDSINTIDRLSMPLAKTMKAIGIAVSDMANLKVATKWDSEGNPIAYRELKKEDFDKVGTNVGLILTTMASAFSQAWYGTGPAFEGIPSGGLKALAEDESGALWSTLYFGRNIGEVIKGISEGVGAMAKMQIPIAWDDKGNPIGYRQLKEKDFKLAGEGVKTILMAMVNAINQVYPLGKQDNGKNIFDMVGGGLFGGDEHSPFVNTLEASLKIGELIGNIGGAVGNIAKMQIPVDWDENGKAIRFRTLKNSDFKQMGDSISIVLTSIIRSLANLYKEGKSFDPEGKNNVFDMVTNIFSSDDPPAIMRVIDASMKISELIANVGQGIKDMATMQIADKWDDKGKPIHYTKLKQTDFTEAGEAVAKIISCFITELSKNSNIFEADLIGDVIESMLPVSELISGMSEGITNLASGLVADQWDPKTGKPIHYKKITSDDYIEAGATIIAITSCMVESLIEAATKKPKGSTKSLLEISQDDTFKNIIEGISGTGELISNIADSVIRIGQAQIPIAWDKDGKPIRYDKIDLMKARIDLSKTLKNIMMATVETIVDLYNNGGLKNLLNGSEDSPFLLATKGLGEITKTVSNIVDSVIKIGQAQIPDRWDKDGKPTHYHPIDVNGAVQNIKDMFEGTTSDGSDGLLMVLCSVINNVATKYFTGNNNISDNIGFVADGMNTIIGTISKSADLVVKIASLKIPMGYDKEGNVKSWQMMKSTDIENAKQNMVTILSSLFDIFQIDMANYINEVENIKSNAETINECLSTIGTTIGAALSQIQNVVKYDKEISQLFKMKSYSKITSTNKTISIGSLRDIFTIIEAYASISNLIIGNTTNFGDTSKLDNVSDHILNISSFISSSILYLYSIINDISEKNIDNFVKYIYNPKSNEYIPTLVKNMVNMYVSSYNSLISNSLTNASVEDVQKRLTNLQINIVQLHKVLAKMFVNYDYLSKQITNAKNNKIDFQDIINTIGFYKLSLKAVNNLYTYFFNNKDIDKDLNLSLLTYNLGQIAKVISTMFAGISDSYSTYYDNIQAFKNNINEIIGQLEVSDNGLSVSMKNLKTNLDYLENIYNTSFKNIDFTKNTILDDITEDVSTFIYKTIDPFDAAAFAKANNLNTSIDNIYQSLSKQQDKSKAFKSNTNALQTYIKAINGVDLKKVNSLSSLVDGLNKLSGQLGNLDRLTEVIANDLAEVLKDLVESLTEAKNTITDAHKLQETRAEQIDKAINKVKNLMNAPLNVNIQSTNAPSDGGTLPSGNDDEDKNKTTTTSSTPGTTSKDTPSTPSQTKKTPGSRVLK